MSGVINVKEYDTIHIFCQYLDDDDIGIDLEGVNISSKVSSLGGTVYHTFDVHISDKSKGEFILFLGEGLLKEGRYLVDILFSSELTRRKVSSDTFQIDVVKSITMGEP